MTLDASRELFSPEDARPPSTHIQWTDPDPGETTDYKKEPDVWLKKSWGTQPPNGIFAPIRVSALGSLP